MEERNKTHSMEHKDQALRENEKIEEYIGILQKEPTEEMLAVTLSEIRRSMKAGSQLVVEVEPSVTDRFNLRTMDIEGKMWIPAYTSFDEELKGGSSLMSTFMAEMGQLFEMALADNNVEGVILNPWNRTLMLDRNLIRIIKGNDV